MTFSFPRPMKTFRLIAAFFLIALCSRAEEIVLTVLDPALSGAREGYFTTWSDSAGAGKNWEKLSPKNVPVVFERKDKTLTRDLYIPNPGIAWCAMGDLTKDRFLRVHHGKVSRGDTLVSATEHRDADGNVVYWGLWAPRDRAHLLVAQMEKLGIRQARVEGDVRPDTGN